MNDAPGMIMLTVALPLLAAFILPVMDRVSSTLARVTGPVLLLLGVFMVGQLWANASTASVIAIGGFAPPLGIVFYIDRLSLVFTLLVLLLSLLLWPYGKHTSIREMSLTLLLAAAACGLALSGDIFNIYVFYELASVASFGLVSATRTGPAFVAAVRYVIISGFGTVLALTGIALVYTQTGTLNLAQLSQLAPAQLDNVVGMIAFVLILLGIGVKAELFPVNTWVPEVYATANKRVTALLAGLVSKLAVIVLVRLLLLVFHSEQALHILLVLGVLGVISGELAAWRSKDVSRMLAYSSIGQLGLVFIAFSIPGEAGVMAGLALALHHLVAKPALFLLAERWGNSIAGLRGAAKVSPIGAGLFVLFALSLVGVPPLPGFWAKLLLVTGLLAQPVSAYWLVMAIILLATVLEANYFFRVVVALYDSPEPAHAAHSHKPHGRLNLATSALFGVALIAVVVYITPVQQFLHDTSMQVSDTQAYVDTVFSHSGEQQ